MTHAPSLSGLRILVVEDEAIIAMLIEDLLADLGCVVVGPAGTVAQALAIAACDGLSLDGGVLDVNLGGEKVFPVADALAKRGIPFIFATGYGKSGVGAQYEGRPVIAKPFSLLAFEQALVEAMAKPPFAS